MDLRQTLLVRVLISAGTMIAHGACRQGTREPDCASALVVDDVAVRGIDINFVARLCAKRTYARHMNLDEYAQKIEQATLGVRDGASVHFRARLAE